MNIRRRGRGGAGRVLLALLLLGGTACMKHGTDGDHRPGGSPFRLEPIGVIRSPYTPETGAPRQGRFAPEVESRIVLRPEYAQGLADVETFTHLIVIYLFDRSKGWSPLVRTPWEERRHGVFATRSPDRPNPIGLTVVKLAGREGNVLHVLGLDAFDGTPVLDIKPYIPRLDRVEGAGGGWVERVRMPAGRSVPSGGKEEPPPR